MHYTLYEMRSFSHILSVSNVIYMCLLDHANIVTFDRPDTIILL